MAETLQITARNVDLPGWAKNDITEKAEKLEKFYDRIVKCRVVVDAPHRHKHEGILYEVRIDLTVPGAELAIKREANEDIAVAIRDAFDAAKRQLEEHARKQRSDVKRHEELPRGRIIKLFLDKGYGFIETPEGTEVYFHRNSVVNRDFESLKIGMDVRFAEEMGDKGPQASSLTVIGT